MNFTVDSTTNIEVLYGIVSAPPVDRLALRLKGGQVLSGQPKFFSNSTGFGYFAFAVKKSSAADILAYDTKGKVVSSGADKIKTAAG
jgi:hypothetical protein